MELIIDIVTGVADRFVDGFVFGLGVLLAYATMKYLGCV